MPPGPFTSLPIRAKVGLLFGLLVLAVFSLAGWASGRWLEPQVTQLHAKRIHDSAVRLATALDVGLFERLREAAYLAEATGAADAGNVRRADLERLRSTHPYYTWIAVTDAKGVIVAATGAEMEGLDVSDRPWWRDAIRGQPGVGNASGSALPQYIDGNDDSGPSRLLDLAVPVRKGDRIAGVLSAQLNWRWVSEIHARVASGLTAGDAIELFAFGRDGESLPLSPSWPAARPMVADVTALANRDPSVQPWTDGGRYLTAAVRRTGYQAPGPGWTVVVRQPLELAAAPARNLRTSIWTLGAAGAACLAVLGWWSAGWVLRPLREVANAAQAQSSLHTAPQGGGNEVQKLAWALGDLVKRLRLRETELLRVTEGLERRVARRTAELERRNADLRTMARMVSHDVRAPIASMMQVLQLAAESDPERQQRLLDMVIRECARVGEVVEALLALSVSESQPLRSTVVDMGHLAAASADRQRTAQGYAGSVDIDVLPLVQGDPVLLGQVWDNLIGNAMKFSRLAAAPRVAVTVSRDDARWAFEVSDNGAGFDEAEAGRLFTAFERLHRDGRYPGTGLGLSIVRRIVERHGGEVRAAGNPGHGASFFFTMPAA